MLQSIFEYSILNRARQNKQVSVQCINLRDYSTDKHRRVDDYQFGGGAGMVMMIEPIVNCIEKLKQQRSYDDIIYMSPDGELLTQPLANRYSLKKNLLILCGHYKGIDQRIRDHYITCEISIGDYVITGGELAAAVFCDSIIRLIPGVISDETSALSDSFQDGMLAPPVYTRPADFKGLKVPDILLSGNPKEIEKWRSEQSMIRTRSKRPGLSS